ncbi:RIP metalloprotease, partial [Candidatus Woesearchaeota archaeon]
VKVVGFARESPATGSGLEKGDVIEGLGPVRVISFDDLNRALSEREPGEEVILRVDGREVPVILGEDPSNPGRAYLGLNLAQDFVVDEGFVRSWGSLMPYALKWLSGFAYWLFVLNLAIGLFNLVPIGPLDGGKMFYVACLRFLSEDRARTASLCVGLFYLSLIVINIAIGFI